MRTRLLLISASALVLCACHRGAGADSAASVLPLETIRLYETGVGYFERSGRISENSSSLPIPASHVDDALKTMIVTAAGGRARVSAIEFESLVSRGLARSLAALPLEADEPVTYRDVLASLKGVEIEIETSRGPVAGQLVEVAEAPPIPLPAGDRARGGRATGAGAGGPGRASRPRSVPDTEDDLYLTVLTENGSVRRLRASRVESVRPTDPTVAARLGSALGALSERAAQIRRSLRVLAASSAPIRLGYVAETPVWRSTYRLVLERGEDRASLQGWALLHNDTDERWAGVTVELVNGRPDSFLFPLSAPRYARRPLAEPAETLSTVPQLAGETADQIWGDHLEQSGTGTGYGYAEGHGRVGRSHRARAPRVRMGSVRVDPAASDEISIGNLADVAQASGVETGALFRYRLGKALDLRAHGSALVPFLQQEVAARRITWFDGAGEQGRSAARVVNTTVQTIPAGPVAVYEPAGFAGETGLRRLKPRERAFLRFGIDLDVELTLDESDRTDTEKKVRFEDGALHVHFVRHHEREYEITNRSASPRVVYLVLDVVDNARVSGADETDYDPDGSQPLAVLHVPARKKATRTIRVDEALDATEALAELTTARLRELAEVATLPAGERDVLSKAATALERVEKKAAERRDADEEIEQLKEDLERMREHLKALGDKSGSPAGENPLVTRILELEDRMARLRRTSEALERERKDLLERVEEELEKLGAAAA